MSKNGAASNERGVEGVPEDLRRRLVLVRVSGPLTWPRRSSEAARL
jgi:hypothetical protein